MMKLRGLGNIVARLTAARRVLDEANAHNHGHSLIEMKGFGSNPGKLRARTFIPAGLRSGAPLVVVLHGCTQNAGVYDLGSGWSQLAQREGFALLFPEQQRANNPNLCFNWYQPDDARRDRGEAMSISQMVKHMTAQHELDPARVYVTGLSAGGAMTSVMLATYPELFAGGAIIAGLPFATANSLPEALARMRGHGGPTRQELAARSLVAARHSGPMPSVSVWHGTHDSIVDPSNASASVDQWRDIHGLGTAPGNVEIVGQHRREVWRDPDGRAIIERYDIRGMGHGTPLATRGNEVCGKVGPHMLDADICSTRMIAAFWGLADADSESREPKREMVERIAVRDTESATSRPHAGHRTGEVGAIIEDALRAAGLMR